MTAMAKDPDDRYQSAAELRDDLVRFHRPTGTGAGPAPGRRDPGDEGASPVSVRADLRPAHERVRRDGGRLRGRRRGEGRRLAAGPGPAGGPPCSWCSWPFWPCSCSSSGATPSGGAPVADIKVTAVKSDTVAQAKSRPQPAGFPQLRRPGPSTANCPERAGYRHLARRPAPWCRPAPHFPRGEHRRPVGCGPEPVGPTVWLTPTRRSRPRTSPKNVPQNSSTVASGLVISTKPKSGNQLQEGSTVNVYCSAGRATTTVPSLQGLNPAQAGAELAGRISRLGRSSGAQCHGQSRAWWPTASRTAVTRNRGGRPSHFTSRTASR